MAKYYVESGTFRTIVQADNGHGAALWAMHLAMEETIPVDELPLSEDQRFDLEFADSAASFGMVMCVSEVGFGRSEAGAFATLEVMTEWNQLTMVIGNLSSTISKQPR